MSKKLAESHGPMPDPNAKAKSATVPSAYRVADGGSLRDRPKRVGHLYFFPHPSYTDPVPKDQEKARQDLEEIARVLRQVFQKRHPGLFQEYFTHLLTIAWGVFSNDGFRPNPLNDLAGFKLEIVQSAGGKVKSEYLWWMLLMVIVFNILIGAVTFGFYKSVQILKESGKIVDVQDNKKAVAGVIRWRDDYSIVHTGVLVAVSMWGILLATSLRNFEPTFETLVAGQADLMPAGIRLLIYAVANTGMAVVMQMKLFTVSIGQTFSTSAISEDLGTAALIGLLLGASERAVVVEIRRLSGEFMSRIQKAPTTHQSKP